MALKPETIARIQGLLDGTIKPGEPLPPLDPSQISDKAKADIKAIWDKVMSSPPKPQPPVPLIGFDEEESVQIEEPNAESLRNADEIIKTLARHDQGDYSAFRKEIALDIYDNGHYNGNWDVSFNPDDYGSDLTGFRVIQEDEYDQHMDEDEDKPDHDDMLADVPNGYLWMN